MKIAFFLSALLCFFFAALAYNIGDTGGGWSENIVVRIIASLFAICGIMLIVGGFYFSSRRNKKALLKQTYPDAPWKWRPEWHNGKIVSSNLTIVLVLTGFALAWSLMTSPLFFLLPEEIKSGNTAAAWGYILPVSGLFVWAVAIYNFFRWRKYGNSIFEITGERGKLGDKLKGTIHLPSAVTPEGSIEISLQCVKRFSQYTVDSRDGSERTSTVETTLWEAKDQRQSSESSLRMGIPIEISIPPTAEPTSADQASNPEIVWRLLVSIPTPGVDFNAQFDVPVF